MGVIEAPGCPRIGLYRSMCFGRLRPHMDRDAYECDSCGFSIDHDAYVANMGNSEALAAAGRWDIGSRLRMLERDADAERSRLEYIASCDPSRFPDDPGKWADRIHAARQLLGRE